jgi:WD40 repeat protein
MAVRHQLGRSRNAALIVTVGAVWLVGRAHASFRFCVPPASLAFSPDGTRLATGETLWEMPSGKLLAMLSGGPPVFAPDGRTLATALGDGKPGLRLWDAGSGKPKAELPHLYPVRALAFSPDGRTLATANQDPLVRLWETRTGRLRRVLQGNGDGLRCLDFSPDGRTLATDGPGTTVRLWDPITGRLRRTLKGSERGVLALAFSPNGELLATTGWDSTVRLWDTGTGTLLASGRELSYVRDVAFSPDGRWVATYSESGKANAVVLWAIQGRPPTVSLTEAWKEGSWIFEQSLIVFSPDGRSFVTETHPGDVSLDDSYFLRDARTQQPRWTREGLNNGSVAFSPDGLTLALAPGRSDYLIGQTMTPLSASEVHLWDAKTGKQKSILRPTR